MKNRNSLTGAPPHLLAKYSWASGLLKTPPVPERTASDGVGQKTVTKAATAATTSKTWLLIDCILILLDFLVIS